MMSGTGSGEQRLHFFKELQSQNFDSIRFASYRTACKLRFIQKKTHMHVIDIWNVIEAFRDSGLNTLEHQMEINVARLEALISSLYHNLNKRLPPQQQVAVETLSSLLLNWLLSAYSAEKTGRIRVFSIKVALSTMCAGKYMDKLRYAFSQICDGNGMIILWKFNEYLQEILFLPAAVYESPSFAFHSQLAWDIFPPNARVTLNDFIDVMMSEPGPPSLVWFPLLHRLAIVESVVHPICCDVCQRENFWGFRYRCQKCHNFQLCQDCFWKGRSASGHTTDHEVKEYTAFKSPSKQIGHTLRKSFKCVPEKGKPNIPRFPEEPEKTINLSHIIPPSPLPSHNGFVEPSASNFNSLDSRSTIRSGGKFSTSLESTKLDDEHKLIARYAARLASEAAIVQGRSNSDGSVSLDTSRAQRELIYQLESKNKEIMNEIARLKKQQEEEEFAGLEDNPDLVTELHALRRRKQELEAQLSILQESRKQLMFQLEGLMKLLKNPPGSPRSTPNSSPRSAKSPPAPTPSKANTAESLTSDVKNAFNTGCVTSSNMSICGRSLRNDLLVAADSVTNAMSTLVRELNSGSDEENNNKPNSNKSIVKPLDLHNVD